MGLIDKDKPWTWLKYKQGSCASCMGTCCTMPVEVHLEDLIQIGVVSPDEANAPKKVFKRLRKEGIVSSYRESSGLYMLSQKANLDCYVGSPGTELEFAL